MTENQPQFTAEDLKVRYECARISFEHQFQKTRWQTTNAEILYNWVVFGIRPFDVGDDKEEFSDAEINLRLKCLDLSVKFRDKVWGNHITGPAEQLYRWITENRDVVIIHHVVESLGQSA